jgi:hypothetical protein
MRRGLWVVVALLAACAHNPGSAPPSTPKPAVGDLLRFKAKQGDAVASRVKLLIEQEVGTAPSEKRPPRTVLLQFSFGEEEQVDGVSPDGAQLVTSRLVDAVGQAGAAADQRMVDDMALAFDELRIQFKRHPRGEVVAVALSGLRRPLDESTARQVVNAMFGAQRGQLFPEDKIDVGGNWKVTLPIPATTGYTGDVRYDYTYARKAGTIATVGCEGRAEGQKAGGGKLTSKSTAEYRFDVASGRLIASTIDQLTQAESVAQGGLPQGLRQHLRIEWTSADATEGKDKDKDKAQ